MADPAPAPAPNGGKTPKTHGLLDKHQLAEISRTNTIYGVANDPATFAKIQDDQIITRRVHDPVGNGFARRQPIHRRRGRRPKLDSQMDTGDEATTKKSLLDKIHYIQSKARMKYPGNIPRAPNTPLART
jgi:hypothetical protein